MQERRVVRRTLAALGARGSDGYAGADLDTGRAFAAATWALVTLLSPAMLALAPPTQSIGPVGWVVAAGLVAVGAAGAWAVRRLESSFTALLGVAYVGVVEVAALQWLSGGDSLYGALFLLWLCPCVIHSPRRALVHLAFLIGAILLPAAYTAVRTRCGSWWPPHCSSRRGGRC